jgi:hypothetical protein
MIARQTTYVYSRIPRIFLISFLPSLIRLRIISILGKYELGRHDTCRFERPVNERSLFSLLKVWQLLSHANQQPMGFS